MVAFVAQWLLIVPALLVVAVIVARRRWRRDLIEALLAGLATILAAKIAATLFAEPRPFVIEHLRPLVPHPADNSFPSDHLAACGLAFAYLFSRSKVMAVIVLPLAAAIAYARVAAHLHWPQDVAAGFFLGVLAALSARYLTSRLSPRRSA